MYRQTFSVTQATVATKIHESFDIHGYLTAKVTFHLAGLINAVSDTCYFRFGKVFCSRIAINIAFRQDLLCS